MALGLILGPILEKNFRQMLQIYRGEYSLFFHRPIAVVMTIIALILIGKGIYDGVRSRTKAKKEKAAQPQTERRERRQCMLFDPIKIGRRTIRNRIVMVAMATNFADISGGATQAMANYYAERAKGGAGLIILENAGVMPNGRNGAVQLRCDVLSNVPGLGRIADGVHYFGAKAILHLQHAGQSTKREYIGETPVGPSRITAPDGTETARELSIEEIRELTEAFAQAAAYAQMAGFLDPRALLECPVSVIASSGIDALSHNLESFYSLKANPMTEAISLKGIELIAKNLPVVYATAAKNQMAALDLFMGSAMGGMAFTSTGTGHMHGIGRYVGPYFHINHGLSITFLMAEVLLFNAMAQPEKTVLTAKAMGVDINGLSQEQVVERLVAAVNRLTKELGLDKQLSTLKATQEVFEHISEDCVKDYLRKPVLLC